MINILLRLTRYFVVAAVNVYTYIFKGVLNIFLEFIYSSGRGFQLKPPVQENFKSDVEVLKFLFREKI